MAPVFPPGAPSAGLSEFLAKLKGFERPRLYDIGPAPGGNIVFFAGRGLRVYVDAERDHRVVGAAPDLTHLASADFEAAVLWDVIDFLPKAPAESFAREIARVVGPGGYAFLLSSASRSEELVPIHSYHVEPGGGLVARPIERAVAKRVKRENRDIMKVFEGFETLSVHLLRSGMREIVLKRRHS